jgi:hypothetical protein
VLASVVRGRSQFGAAAPMARDAASTELVGELPLGMGSTRPLRVALGSAGVQGDSGRRR